MKYNTIVIDPPWNQGKTGLRSVRPNQGRTLNYSTMTLDEIKCFPIDDFAEENAHIYLWTINKFLRDAFDVLKEWKFKFHVVLVWRKPTGVTPFSFQFVNEYVLFGYRGKFKIGKMGIPTTFDAKVREHSRKPDELYEIAELCSLSPRIDIFSREKRQGWDQWGDELDYHSSCQKAIKDDA
jgi:N6-adenosine-specific RNA methylase IME4